jgi:colanic acid biosynthesis glycosyl transferase WcaI
LRRTWLTLILYAIEAFSYRHAWRVSGISRGMLAALTAKGVPVARQIYFPNGIRLEASPPRGAFRARQGFSPADFLVVYSGNIGVKQGLHVLVNASRLLRNERIHIVICGDGAERPSIESKVADLHNVHLLSLLPEQEYHQMLSDCDLAIIPQLPGTGRVFFPSKLLPPLAHGRPILGVADEDSQLALAIAEAGCGCSIRPNDLQNLSATLERLAADPTQLEAWGKAGRVWVEQFERDQVLAAFAKALA